MIHFKPNIFIKNIFDKPFGLSYLPTLEPDISDSSVCFKNYQAYTHDNSDNSPEILNIVKNTISTFPADILEIGVSLYKRELTITHQLISNKKSENKYLGIDIEDRSFVQSWGDNCSFYRENSSNFESVKSKLNELNISNLGIIVIDGNHSVNSALKDWKYVELLDKNGFVLIHDTNTHPGPIALLSAIDRKIFNVEEPLHDKYDHGIAIISYR